MTTYSAILFFSLVGVLVALTAASIWNLTEEDYEARQLKYKDKLPTKISQFYNEDGSMKKHYLSLRPAECERDASKGIRRGTPLAWCPTPSLLDVWDWKCIRFEDLCNKIRDCPNGEDEAHEFCFHHRLQNGQMEKLSYKVEEMLWRSEHVNAEGFKDGSK